VANHCSKAKSRSPGFHIDLRCIRLTLAPRSYIDQLNLILQTLGTPDESTLDRVGSERACQYIRSLPKSEKVPFAELFPNAEPSGKPLSVETRFETCKADDPND